jgi:PTH1 family peptidyl-tRNA hydrolase
MIKAIIGLGNPGNKYKNTRHNVGFMVVDALSHHYEGQWKQTSLLEYTIISINNEELLLIKPLTFMNDSGKVIPWLAQKGIKADSLLVVHDELEQPFGKVRLKQGGSARGHNGLRSIIQVIGPDFNRLQIGIGRPATKEEVPTYVLSPFEQSAAEINQVISAAVKMILSLLTLQ